MEFHLNRTAELALFWIFLTLGVLFVAVVDWTSDRIGAEGIIACILCFVIAIFSYYSFSCAKKILLTDDALVVLPFGLSIPYSEIISAEPAAKELFSSHKDLNKIILQVDSERNLAITTHLVWHNDQISMRVAHMRDRIRFLKILQQKITEKQAYGA